MPVRSILATLFAAVLVFSISACDQPSGPPEVPEPVADAASDARDALDDAADELVDAVADDDGDEPTEEAQEDSFSLDLPGIPGNGIDADRFAEHVKILSSDEFEGRAPGTKGEELTLDYLVEQFRELGLEPGWGDDYLQPVPMLELQNVARSDLEFAFEEDELTLGYPDDMIISTLRGGEQVQGVEDSDVIFVGYGIVAPEYDWDDYAGIDVEGKTVVILVNDPGFATEDEALFNGRAMTYYGRWTYKYEEAARQGAGAALIVHETEPASYPWEVVINSWSGSEFVLASDESPRVALEGWLTVDAANTLFETAGQDYNELKNSASQPDFKAVELGGKLTASAQNRDIEGISYNVLAQLPGKVSPDEAVLYTAHWDHLGVDPDIEGSDGIYSGAIDNASGVAGLLEIARLFAAAGPAERTAIFGAVTLEESGLLGSEEYSNNPAYPPEKTAAAVNMDALSIIGPTRDVVVVGYGSSQLEDILADAAATQNRTLVPEFSPEAGSYYRSDHFNLAKIGIPALYAKGGVDHREEGREYGLEQSADYGRNRYHKPADKYNENWDLRGVVEDLELFYLVGRAVADSDSWPEWYEGNEFRAIREDSLK